MPAHTPDRAEDVLPRVLADLRAESEALDGIVARLDDDDWRRATPAPGWTIAHQIAHLTWTDEVALLSATDPAAFADVLREVVAAGDGEAAVDRAAASGAAAPPARLLARWRTGRAGLDDALRATSPAHRLAWFGPAMAPASMATARLMETWAHGLDVADALGLPLTASGRLWHVARLAVRTRDFSFLARGKTPPTHEFRVELSAPDGGVWSFGPQDAAQRVTGAALDLCLVAVQRRHRADTGLVAVGADADAWLDVAQAFAGPPGGGRAPRSTT
jgi:uncharacterized protein (TIGR03084 family)